VTLSIWWLMLGCGRPDPVRLVATIHQEGWQLWGHPQTTRDLLSEMSAQSELAAAHGAAFSWEVRELLPIGRDLGALDLAILTHRGHSVGFHGDVGHFNAQFLLDGFLESYRADGVALGAEMAQASGICSPLDWVGAAERAGFRAVTGATCRCLQSLDPENLTPELASAAANTLCHEPWPPSLQGRLYPWRLGPSGDWLGHHPDGGLIMFPTSISLDCNDEAAAGLNTFDCELSKADLDIWFQTLDEALALADPGWFPTFQTTWSMGAPPDHAMLEAWLERVEPYLRDERVVWLSASDLVDEYEAWEGGG